MARIRHRVGEGEDSWPKIRGQTEVVLWTDEITTAGNAAHLQGLDDNPLLANKTTLDPDLRTIGVISSRNSYTSLPQISLCGLGVSAGGSTVRKAD
jgi:hypothetical protein